MIRLHEHQKKLLCLSFCAFFKAIQYSMPFFADLLLNCATDEKPFNSLLGTAVGSTYSVSQLKTKQDVLQQGRLPLYYKSHFPFMTHAGSLARIAEKAIVLIRNPMDAGFSEYIR